MIRRIVTVWMSSLMLFSFIVINMEVIPPIKGALITVDDDGPADYANIQDAIDNASTGDTIYVKNGTYYEQVVVDVTVNLTGEARENVKISWGGEYQDTVIIYAHWVNITSFTITNGGFYQEDAGMQINSNHNTIYGNNISSCNVEGIFICGDKNNIFDNILYDNGRGIRIWDHYNNITNNNFTRNFNDIYGEGAYGNRIINNTECEIQFYYSDHNLISDNICTIYFEDSNDNIIVNNTVYSLEFNYDCQRNNITNNQISGPGYGIELNLFPGAGPFEGNNIIDNNISSNGGNGIYINGYGDNNIINNIICSNGDSGIELWGSGTNNVISNNISWNQNGGMYMPLSSQNVISFNHIAHNNGTGVGSGQSGNHNINNNIIEDNNGSGIYLVDSNSNTIMNNVISNNSYGVRLTGSSPPFMISKNNRIYHNNFLNNTNQSYDQTNMGNYWDNGYPEGGNYWSDYSGIDIYKGPGQDIIGSDGIGDTNYSIDADSIDNYPLIQPYPNSYIFLHEGWNIISVPRIQSDTSVGSVLQDIQGDYDALQFYNSSDSTNYWKHNHISKPSDLNDMNIIDHTMGLWIHVTNPNGTVFLFDGIKPTQNQSIDLHAGWNLVGYPSWENKLRDTALNNLTYGVEVDSIWTFNAASQTWMDIGPSDSFELGRGYWIHATQECVWEVSL